MKTYEITKAEAGEAICEGYKAVNYDGLTMGDKNFRYAKEGENLIGKIFTVDGDIRECHWGLHFSKDPAHVFNFYRPLGYNRYFKVRAYGKAVDTEDKTKTVAQTIEFVEEYDLMEFLDVVKGFDRQGSGINYGSGIDCSYGIDSGYGINHGYGISYGYGINHGSGIDSGSGISDGYGINCGYGINHGYGISYGYGINYGKGINHGSGINCGYGISDGSGIDSGYGINCGYGLKNCKGVYNSAFCVNKNGIANCLFNKQSTEERCREVINNLLRFNWYPKFMNWDEVKGNKDWWAFCFPKLKAVSKKEAWAKMPQKMKKYIKSLPEFDAEIWAEITGEEG